MIYMKKIITVLLCINCYVLYSQTPQFAVVRPNGVSFMCPNWDSAYNVAQNDDYVFFPGVGLNTNVSINKRLYIIGAGHHPDSTLVTNPTVINGELRFTKNSSGSVIEGIKVNGSTYFGTSSADSRATNISFKRMFLTTLILNYSTAGTIPDSLPHNLYFTENIIGSISGASSHDNYFLKNIIYGQVNNLINNVFHNNNFLMQYPTVIGGANSMTNVINSLFENNIFLNLDPNTAPSQGQTGNCNNTYRNNLKYFQAEFNGSTSCPILSQNNNLSAANISDIFVSYPTIGFLYTHNFHLKSGSAGIGGGTDGTDVGIYGTSQPVSEGWVPSNPHIYFKQIAPQTNTNGTLPVQIKVRANN